MRRAECFYPSAERWKLIRLVENRCCALGRVVSSKDLTSYLKARPDERPLLLQPMGQLLFKASQPSILPAPRLTQYGIIGNSAFYAHESTTIWRESFEKHALQSRVAAVLRLAMAEYATALIDTQYESLARNSTAGFIREFEPLATHPALVGWEFHTRLLELLAVAARLKRDDYRPATASLISRSAAREILVREYAIRREGFITDRLNANRHLAILRYPQSALLRPAPGMHYLKDQIAAYAHAQWPISDEDMIQAAVWRCLAYGAPAN